MQDADDVRPFSLDDVIRAARDWRYSNELIGGMMRRWIKECGAGEHSDGDVAR